MPCRYACSAGRPLPGTRSDTLRAMPTAAGSWQGSGNRSVRAGIIEAGMVTAAVDHSHTVYGRGPDRHGLGVGLTGAAAQPLPAPPDGPRPIESLTSEEHLRTVVARLSRSVELSASAGADSEPLGSVLVFRPWPARSLHVVGESPLAGEFRRLVTAGAVPGWQLHPVPPGRTPLEALAGPLLRRTGSRRFYNILERHGFAYVEDVAATPDECLLELRNSGPRLIAAVRAVISELGPEDDTAGPAGPDGHVARLAAELLGETDERRRLILTSRTFAPGERTYDSLARELGISRERVRQLEGDALTRLTQAARHNRYAPLRWRAASAAQNGVALPALADAPPWMAKLLFWLASKTG